MIFNAFLSQNLTQIQHFTIFYEIICTFSLVSLDGKWKKLGHCTNFHILFFRLTHTDWRRAMHHSYHTPCKITLRISTATREMCQIFLFHYTLFLFWRTRMRLGGKLIFIWENENHNKRNTHNEVFVVIIKVVFVMNENLYKMDRVRWVVFVLGR